MVYVILGKGFEEIEAVAPVDILRRGGVDVAFAGVDGMKITGAHRIDVCCDMTVDEIDLSKAELIVVPGGLGGVMHEVMKGCKASKNYREGDTVALIPSFDPTIASEYADIVIPTGLDAMRNALVANADAVVGVGGGAGTLCEFAFAWSFKRLIIAFENSGGWSEKLAGTRLDDTVRYPDIPEDKVYPVRSADEAAALLKKYLGKYVTRYTGIKK